jgi:DNA-binding CsgD family transcriptional regulator
LLVVGFLTGAHTNFDLCEGVAIMSQFAARTQNESRRLIEDRLRGVCEEIAPSELSLLSQNDDQVILDFVYGNVRCVLFRAQPISGQNLSPREREIVRLVAAGHPNKVIAAVLEISYWTVGTHLRRIFAKLGVTSRAAMVARFGTGQSGPSGTRDDTV